MVALTIVLIGLVAILLLGALAVEFGADSRDGAEDGTWDPTLTVARGAR